MQRQIPFLAAIGVLALSCSTAAAADQRAIVIGAGAQSGTAYFLAQQICRLVGEAKRIVAPCSAQWSGGSLSNLAGLNTGEYTLAFAQSDWHHHAVKGTGPFRDRGADAKLRSLFSAHAELMVVLVRAETGIKSIGELRGKRLNIGPVASAQRQSFERVMSEFRWAMRDFAVVAELRQQPGAEVLCKGRVDAAIHVGAHPDAELKEAAESCEVAAVPVAGAEIDRLVGENGPYIKSAIPGGVYRGLGKDIPSIGTVATVVTTADLDAAIAYDIVRTVFENAARLKRSHPALARLEPKRMAADGLAAPLHEGAARYYREKGWIR